jgi:hypothetical protein
MISLLACKRHDDQIEATDRKQDKQAETFQKTGHNRAFKLGRWVLAEN